MDDTTTVRRRCTQCSSRKNLIAVDLIPDIQANKYYQCSVCSSILSDTNGEFIQEITKKSVLKALSIAANGELVFQFLLRNNGKFVGLERHVRSKVTGWVDIYCSHYMALFMPGNNCYSFPCRTVTSSFGGSGYIKHTDKFPLNNENLLLSAANMIYDAIQDGRKHPIVGTTFECIATEHSKENGIKLPIKESVSRSFTPVFVEDSTAYDASFHTLPVAELKNAT